MSGRAYRHGRGELVLLVGGAVLLLVFANGWLCDDSFITFRASYHLAHGLGPRWNVAERVQAFTNPLWMGGVAIGLLFTNAIYVVAFGLSLACTAGALFLVARSSRVGRSPPHPPFAPPSADTQSGSQGGWRGGTPRPTAAHRREASPRPTAAHRREASPREAPPRDYPIALAFGGLLVSKAFIHYSTSGLENPLGHLLLAAQFFVVVRPRDDGAPLRRAFWSTLVIALAAVNRLDAVVMQAPLWLATLAPAYRSTSWRRLFRAVTVGLSPLLAWELFALFYFGFLFPNTAYAKLASGIPTGELAVQGVLYLVSLVTLDAVGVLVIAAGLVFAFAGRDRPSRLLAAGVLLHLLYLVRIGGDFMAGRMLSGCLLAGAILIARNAPARGPALVPFAALLGVLALGGDGALMKPLAHPLLGIFPSGVVDERSLYVDDTSPLRVTRTTLNGPVVPATAPWALEGVAARGRGVVVCDHTGFYGYNAGDDVYIIDPLALTDPLLARLPALPDSRVGHYERLLPNGYVDTVTSGVDALSDPNLNAYYGHLRRVTRAPLLDGARLRDLVSFQVGRFDHLLPTR